MLLHKYKIHILSLLLLPFMGSCINESFDDCNLGGYDSELPEGNFIISFDIKLPETYALEDSDVSFENGSHNEHQVNEHAMYAIFFDANDNLVNIVDVLTKHYDKDDENKDIEHVVPDKVEGRYYATYKVKRNKIKPASVVVVINVSSDVKKKIDNLYAKNAPLSEVMNIIWEDKNDPRKIGHDGNYQYFTMSNSVYANGQGKLVGAVKLNSNPEEGHFVPEEDLVDKNVEPYSSWTGTPFESRILVIPVERMVAKFSFGVNTKADDYDEENMIFTPDNNSLMVFDDIDDDGNFTYKNYNYKVKLIGWGVNALETESYLIKSLAENTKYFDNWTDTEKWRSYWAHDPHYRYSGEYPRQFRKALDNPSLSFYQKDIHLKEGKETNVLHNYSYNDLSNSFDGVLYSPENTYDIVYDYPVWLGRYSGDLHFHVGTHIILSAELLTNFEGNEYKSGHVFHDRNGIWYKNEEDLFKAMIQILHNEFKSQAELHFYYKDWGHDKIKYLKPRENDNGEVEKDNSGNFILVEGFESNGEEVVVDTHNHDWFFYYKDTKITFENYTEVYKQIKQDDATVTNALEKADNDCYTTAKSYITHSDGQRILWFNNISIRNDQGETLKRCKVLGTDDRGNVIRYPIGELDHNHIKSLLYEWLGVVDHFNNGKMYYAAPVMNVPGNYGVVRNAWYKFTLSDINSLGTSVDDPEEAIVPNSVNKENQLNFDVNRIGWHVFNIDVPNL